MKLLMLSSLIFWFRLENDAIESFSLEGFSFASHLLNKKENFLLIFSRSPRFSSGKVFNLCEFLEFFVSSGTTVEEVLTSDKCISSIFFSYNISSCFSRALSSKPSRISYLDLVSAM